MNPWQRWRDATRRLEVAQARVELERQVLKHATARLGGLTRARDRILEELQELHAELAGPGGRIESTVLEIPEPEAQPKGPGVSERFAGCGPDP